MITLLAFYDLPTLADEAAIWVIMGDCHVLSDLKTCK